MVTLKVPQPAPKGIVTVSSFRVAAVMVAGIPLILTVSSPGVVLKPAPKRVSVPPGQSGLWVKPRISRTPPSKGPKARPDRLQLVELLGPAAAGGGHEQQEPSARRGVRCAKRGGARSPGQSRGGKECGRGREEAFTVNLAWEELG